MWLYTSLYMSQSNLHMGASLSTKIVALLNQRAREFSTVLDIPKLLSRIMNYCVLLPAGVKVSLFTCSSYLTNSCHGQS